MQITGSSLIGTVSENTARTTTDNKGFFGLNAKTGEPLEPSFSSASPADVERAATLAQEAFAFTKALSGQEKAKFLRLIASKMEEAKAPIIERACLETALPEARITGELGRTTSQLRLFADLVEEGSWLDARIDQGDPTRQPLPKPDVRSMLRPLGPVIVFGASNFPLAFSVAGGDTAAAFAAGCPVIVKGHPAHPGTSELVGRLISEAARECNWPEGAFSLLFDEGHEVGLALVRHPAVKAVGFTGSRKGGLALVQAAASREVPIPVFAEMSSINPTIITEEALKTRGAAIATSLHGAVTLGVGQFCTNPGLVLLPVGELGDAFIADLAARLGETPTGSMLTAGICAAYQQGIKTLSNQQNVVAHVKATAEIEGASAALFEVDAETLCHHPALMNEVFGPSTLVVRYRSAAELQDVVNRLEGQLTATLHVEAAEMASYGQLISSLEGKVGRLIINGFPTGVEVCHAMVHGGPFPATSDSRSTSVGSASILRFVRPVCFQGFPDSALPAELQNSNPLGITRLVNGQRTTSPLS